MDSMEHHARTDWAEQLRDVWMVKQECLDGLTQTLPHWSADASEDLYL